MTRVTKYIYFYNNTELPIMVSMWIDGSNKLHEEKIESQERRILHSSVGEWHLNAMFPDDADCAKWKNKGLKQLIIGKFRSNPCAVGNYVWMEYDRPFDCIYSKIPMSEDNKPTGQITFSYTDEQQK